MSTVPLRLTVDGVRQELDVEPRLLLVHLLRDELGLTGTHVGCDTTSCGACTVHVDGEAVKSCTLLALQATDAEVTTIEGLAPRPEPRTPCAELAAEGTEPPGDLNATPDYKRHLARVLARRALEAAAGS